MDRDNTEKRNCEQFGEYRIHCYICNKLAVDRFYENHRKSPTHLTIFLESQQLNNTNNST